MAGSMHQNVTRVVYSIACSMVLSATGAHAVTLTPITTGFNQPIGIDHHQPTNKVVLSVNYPSGQPYNFELVASNGTRTQFSSVSGLTDEVKIATVRDTLGGFNIGELFVGTGVPGQIARVSADGLTVQNPWVTLPGEPGLMRGSLHVDRTGVFGGDLIVVTTAGNVWRISSAGAATQLASLGTHLEGLATIPNDPVKYGPWAGKILAGAEGQGRLYAIDVSGTATYYMLGINPEDIEIIPANQNFFGVDYASQTLVGAPPSEFAGMIGDVLIAQEFPGVLWHVKWDTATASFQTTQVAQVGQWEHVTFSTAGIVEIPPVEVCGDGLDNDNDGLVDEDCPTQTGRMTGGGSVFTSTGMRVTHGFQLNCDTTDDTNSLQINWGNGNKFHLESLTSAVCTDDSSINPHPPAAGFDTFQGTGEGLYNGTSGATIEWTFTDAGEPGVSDSAQIVVKDSSSAIVLSVSGNLRKGNHQAHKH